MHAAGTTTGHPRRSIRRTVGLGLMAAMIVSYGCQTTYYAIWEQLGKEKRHLLHDNLEQVQRDQAQAAGQFAAVVDRIQALYGFDGGELESVYRKLSADFEHCKARATSVRERIAADLFGEWEAELAAIENKRMQATSRASLKDTRRRFARLQRVMRQADASMDPVLTSLRDYVLYLKHNLNAQAVSSLKGEVASIEADVASLIADMNRSIEEADAFVQAM